MRCSSKGLKWNILGKQIDSQNAEIKNTELTQNWIFGKRQPKREMTNVLVFQDNERGKTS